MTYLELMAAYNQVKSKLLVKSILADNLPDMDKTDQESFFLDYRFYNLKLTFVENKNLKILLAKKLGYTGVLIFGNVKHNILFKGMSIARGEKLRYNPAGLVLSHDSQTYRYKFNQLTFVKRIYLNKVKLTDLTFNYSSMYLRESFTAYMEKNMPKFKKYVAQIEYDPINNAIRLFWKNVPVPEAFKKELDNQPYFEGKSTKDGCMLCR